MPVKSIRLRIVEDEELESIRHDGCPELVEVWNSWADTRYAVLEVCYEGENTSWSPVDIV